VRPPLPALRLGIALALALPAAARAIDWNAAAGVEVPEVVTADPDGETRTTNVWMVVVDGEGYLRTGDTRWFANLERDPDLVLRVEGTEHPLRAFFVTDAPLRGRVIQAFRDKYGWEDRLLGVFGDDADARIIRLDPRTESQPEPKEHR
jgi:hypothetical protein